MAVASLSSYAYSHGFFPLPYRVHMSNYKQRTLPAFSGSHGDALLNMQDEPGFPARSAISFAATWPTVDYYPEQVCTWTPYTAVLTTLKTVCMQRQGEGGRSGMYVGCIGVIHPRRATHRVP